MTPHLRRSAEDSDDTSAESDTVVIPIVQEEARVEKREVEHGRVRVTTHTDLVEDHIRESLRTSEVEVTRVSVNRTLDPGEAAPKIRTEGDITIIPILEEIVLVERRLILKEEVHILREIATEDVDVPITLRKQRAVIEQVGPEGHSVRNNE